MAETVEAADTLKALAILVRFENEVTGVGSDAGCGADPWPEGPGPLPAWANELLEMDDTPDNPNSMTYFFHLMSGGDHLLMGETHDQVVTLPDPNLFPSRTELNLAVIDSVDAHRDLTVYDYDVNGVVDFLFVVYRQKFTCTSGVAPLRWTG
jgi:hypothetical protein